MLEITNSLFTEAIKLWENHGMGIDLFRYDDRFHSRETILNRRKCSDRIMEEKMENHLQVSIKDAVLKDITSLEPDCSCFDLVFGEIRKAISDGSVLLVAEDMYDDISYYIGTADNNSVYFIYSTSYGSGDDDASGDAPSYLMDTLIIYGFLDNIKPDSYFRVIISGDSEWIKTKRDRSDTGNMFYWLIRNMYISKIDELTD